MKPDCDMIRDLLPLYADSVCSETSRAAVEEHLLACPDCRAQLDSLRQSELENDLLIERDRILSDAKRRFRRRSAAVGSAVSGAVTVPVLLLLALSVSIRPSLTWVTVVVAALCVAASLVLVPLLAPEDKLFWTFCAFTVSLLLLLGVACLYSGGHWFWIASSAVLFGLCAVFLPFLLRAEPVKAALGNASRPLVCLGADLALLINMLNMIAARGRVTLNSLLFSAAVIAGSAVVLTELVRRTRARK